MYLLLTKARERENDAKYINNGNQLYISVAL